jgi:hypothetical protein
MIFESVVGGIAVFVLMLVLDSFFCPRCERHGAKVFISKIPSLGCEVCIIEDIRRYHKQKAEEQAINDFIVTLEKFCTEDVPQTYAVLNKLKRSSRSWYG